MSSRFASSLSGNAGRRPTRMSVRTDQRAMSEKQIQAYLVSRDALRHIQRTSSLFLPLRGRTLDVIERTQTGLRHDSSAPIDRVGS